MKVVNLFEVEVGRDDDDPLGYDTGYARLAERLGATKLGATLYELPRGQSICPYHYEYGNEEWLVVLSGRPTLRTPEGERELEPGATVCFPDGPAGAHKVTNAGEEPARVLILSTKMSPDAAVYPDSNKIGIWTGNKADDPYRLFRIDSAVDYWDGEAER